MDANIQLTIDSFRKLFPDKIFFPDISLTFSKIPAFPFFQTSGDLDHCGVDTILRANVTLDQGLPCLGVVGASVWGSALLVVSFSVLISILLCSLGGPQHPAHEGVKSLGILFMTWRAQGVMNGRLIVFLTTSQLHSNLETLGSVQLRQTLAL